jgi:hypothetical protein
MIRPVSAEWNESRCHTKGMESYQKCGAIPQFWLVWSHNRDVVLMWHRESFFGATSNCGGMAVYGLHGTTLAIRFHTGCSFPDVIAFLAIPKSKYWNYCNFIAYDVTFS